jgi:hypothetical protein
LPGSVEHRNAGSTRENLSKGAGTFSSSQSMVRAGMFAFVSMFQVIGVSRRALLCLHVAIDCSNFDSQHDGVSIVSPLRWQAQRTAKLDFSSSCFLI